MTYCQYGTGRSSLDRFLWLLESHIRRVTNNYNQMQIFLVAFLVHLDLLSKFDFLKEIVYLDLHWQKPESWIRNFTLNGT